MTAVGVDPHLFWRITSQARWTAPMGLCMVPLGRCLGYAMLYIRLLPLAYGYCGGELAESLNFLPSTSSLWTWYSNKLRPSFGDNVGTKPVPTANHSLKDTETYGWYSWYRQGKHDVSVFGIMRTHSAVNSVDALHHRFVIARSSSTARRMEGDRRCLTNSQIAWPTVS
jgi:hypothetical protein